MFQVHTRLLATDPACKTQLVHESACDWDMLINLLCASPNFNFAEFIVEIDEIDLALMDKGTDYET